MKRMLTATLAISLLLFGCGAVETATGTDERQETTNETESFEMESYKTAATEPAENANAPVFLLGETAEYNGIRITMSDAIESSGTDEFSQPSFGNIFVLVKFDITNGSSSDFPIGSFEFSAYADGFGVGSSVYASTVISELFGHEAELLTYSSLAPGKVLSGWVGYEIPASWKQLEIRYGSTVYQDPYVASFVVTKVYEDDSDDWVEEEGDYGIPADEGPFYLLQYGDSKFYTEDELWWLKQDPEDIRKCINEMYAKHGYIFKSKKWNDYFNQQDWYQGTIPADQFDDSVFNEYERANLKLLLQMEATYAK